MDAQHPALDKIADLRTTLAQDKESALAALLDSKHRESFKAHIHTLIEDLEWIFERMGADGP